MDFLKVIRSHEELLYEVMTSWASASSDRAARVVPGGFRVAVLKK
jgi:hypothetical protein